MVKRIKTAVLVSGSGSNLQALIDAGQRGEMPHVALSLVVSSRPESYALKRAEAHGLPCAAVDRRQYGGDGAAFERALLALLEEHGIELIVLAGFLTIFSSDFAARFPQRMINVHPSLIPSFCGKGFYGLRVHQAVLQYGVKVSGATVHYVNETVDGGRIILQKAVEVLDGDTPEALQDRILRQAEWQLLPQAAEMAAKNLLAEG